MRTLFILLLVVLMVISIIGCDNGVVDETYTLTVEIVGEGTVNLEEGEHKYDEVTTVDLVANSADNYEFSHWEGNVTDFEKKETSVIVDKDIIVKAVFFPELDGEFAGGLGIEGYPYLIETAEQLNNVRDHSDKHFKQTADIDLSEYSQGEGWYPIGNILNIFSGVFDGNGYKIINLTIERPDEDLIGLFKGLERDAVIKNIELKEVNITGNDSVGAIVGHNFSGKIINSSVEGGVNGGNAVGLLVGSSEEGQIINSHVEGDVTGTEGLGGLVGYNREGYIKDSYAQGTVTGNDHLGGLVGAYNGGSIESSYAKVDVVGKNAIGGLIGNLNWGTIDSSHATGDVWGEVGVGGLVGASNGGTIDSTHALGTVNGDYFAGGLVGANSSLIKNSHALGDVLGECCVGGFVGKNFSEGAIEEAYAAGEVTGTENAGKFIGEDESDLTENTYLLTISAEGEGTVVPVAATHIFTEDTVVELEAYPVFGWIFEEWAGPDGDDVFASEESSIDRSKGEITLSDDKKVTAVFSESEMVPVKAGTTSADNGSVTVEEDFYIGKYHVTQAEFEVVMGFNPSYFNSEDHPNLTGYSTNRPVERVTWYDAVMFCNKLSESEGLDKYYDISDIEYKGDDADDWEHPKNIYSATVTENEEANGYRLPTKDEHEYAARGGKDGNPTTYAGSNNLDEVGWHRDNSQAANSEHDVYYGKGNGTMPVGRKEANELGIYDMSGNVYDWTNTTSSLHGDSHLIRRGGSWSSETHLYCYFRVNSRLPSRPSIIGSGVGFRLTRSP